jgi:hypothetical protein
MKVVKSTYAAPASTVEAFRLADHRGELSISDVLRSAEIGGTVTFIINDHEHKVRLIERIEISEAEFDHLINGN